jgi:acetyl-CoA carboxylase biotin carboxyl carrier protein
MDLSEDDVIQIMRLLNESKFEALHLEMGNLKLVINKHDQVGAVSESTAQASTLAVVGIEREISISQKVPKLAPIEPEPRNELDRSGKPMELEKEGLISIHSPMLGTFYRAPNPTAPPFVEVGEMVTEEDTVCVIEVMKLYSAIKAGLRGRIAKVCAENEEMVEYNQVLFLVEPETD